MLGVWCIQRGVSQRQFDGTVKCQLTAAHILCLVPHEIFRGNMHLHSVRMYVAAQSQLHKHFMGVRV